MDTPRYRIGNDLTILWAISNRDGSPYNLEGKEVRLFVTNERGREEVDVILSTLPDGSVNNVIRWDFKGEDQRTLGGHTLTVEIQTAEDHREIKKDFCEAFVLVGSSCAECIDDGDANIMDGGELILSSRLDIYMFGGVGQGLVSKIYNEDNFGSVFSKGSKIDTFNAHAINTLYERLRDLKIGDVTDIAISNPKSDNLLVFNGHSWVNVTAKSLFDKYGTGSSGGSGSGSSGDSFWYMGDDGKVHIDYDIYVAGNATMDGDTSADGEGGASVGITGITLNGTTYRDTDGDGIIDLGEITGGGGTITEITSAMVVKALGYTPYDASNPNGYITAAAVPTKVSALTNDAGYITASALGGYATQSWVEGKGYITATALNGYITESAVNSKLAGYLPLTGGTITGNGAGLGVSLFVSGSTQVTGQLAVSSAFSADGTAGVAGVFIRNEGGIEISHASTPYIDFHLKNATSDFSNRLICDTLGRLQVQNNFRVTGTTWMQGALTADAGATITGNSTINGNLIVTGDISA